MGEFYLDDWTSEDTMIWSKMVATVVEVREQYPR